MKTLSLLLLMTVSVAAHDAIQTAAMPQGWSYPYSCCSGYDCREVPASSVREWKGSYVVKNTGEVLMHNDPRLRNSPDGRYHWCSEGGSDFTKTICLWVPPPAY